MPSPHQSAAACGGAGTATREDLIEKLFCVLAGTPSLILPRRSNL